MTLPPLPEPDPHCWDDDYLRDNWIYSADQLREYGKACAAWEREHGPCGHGAGCSYEAATRDAEIEAAVADEHTRILTWLDAALDDPDVCWPAEVDILRDQIVSGRAKT